jgi:cytochrome c556
MANRVLKLMAALAVVVLVGGIAAADIDGLMKKMNKGPNKAIRDGLKEASPDWAKLEKAAKEYAEIVEANGKLEPGKGGKDSWKKQNDNWANDIKEFTQAVGKKDKAAAEKAFKSVQKRCDECHEVHRD